jgi:hypothetical protein
VEAVAETTGFGQVIRLNSLPLRLRAGWLTARCGHIGNGNVMATTDIDSSPVGATTGGYGQAEAGRRTVTFLGLVEIVAAVRVRVGESMPARVR